MNFQYFYIFSQTCLLELPIYFLFLHGQWPFRTALIAVIAINALTHPLVFLGLMAWPASAVAKISISEVFAPTVEALALIYFFRINAVRAITASILANLVSWQIGPLFTYWIVVK